MNYIKEIRAFYDWQQYNTLSTGEFALWHALMHINNKTGWMKEFTVANQVLQSLTGLSRQGMDKARNGLIQKGRIKYSKGKGNRAGKYQVISFECQIIGTKVAQMDTQTTTQKGHSSSTLNKQNGFNSCCSSSDPCEEDDVVDINFGKVITAFNQNIKPITPIEGEILRDWASRIEVDAIIIAIAESVKNGAMNIKYIEGILKNWEKLGHTTADGVRAYMREYEAKKNRNIGTNENGSRKNQGRTATTKNTNNRFHNFDQKTDEYSNDELEKMLGIKS